MSTQVNLSENVILGLKRIQDNYNDIVDKIFQVEEYIMSVENEQVSADKTLAALRALKEIDKFISPLEV